jgi:hypothetical protein
VATYEAASRIARHRGGFRAPADVTGLRLVPWAEAETTLWDGLWLRLVDVEAGLAARTYAPAGSLRVQVRDDFCPWNTGTYEVGEGGCRRTAGEPDRAVAADALGACFLGGNRFATLARAGRVEERTAGGAGRTCSSPPPLSRGAPSTSDVSLTGA